MEKSAWTTHPHAVENISEDGSLLSSGNFVSFQFRGASSTPVVAVARSRESTRFEFELSADDADAVLYQGGRLWVVPKPSVLGRGESVGLRLKSAYRCSPGSPETSSTEWRAFCIPVATAFSRYWDEKRAAAGRREGAASSEGRSSMSAGRLYRSRVTQACSVLTAALARVGAPPPTDTTLSHPAESAASPSSAAAPSPDRQVPAGAEGSTGEADAQAATASAQAEAGRSEAEAEGQGDDAHDLDGLSPSNESPEARAKRSHRARKRTIREARERDAARLAMLVTMANNIDVNELMAAMKDLQVSGQVDEASIQLGTAALSGRLQASAPAHDHDAALDSPTVAGGGNGLAKLLSSWAQDSKPSRVSAPSAMSSRISSTPSSRGRGDMFAASGRSPVALDGRGGEMYGRHRGGGGGAYGSRTSAYSGPGDEWGSSRFADDRRGQHEPGYPPSHRPPGGYAPYASGFGRGAGSGANAAEQWDARSSSHHSSTQQASHAGGLPTQAPPPRFVTSTPYMAGPVIVQQLPQTSFMPQQQQQQQPMVYQAGTGGTTYIQAYNGTGVPVSMGMSSYPSAVSMPSAAYTIPMLAMQTVQTMQAMPNMGIMGNMSMGVPVLLAPQQMQVGQVGMSTGQAGYGTQQYMVPITAVQGMRMTNGEQGGS